MSKIYPWPVPLVQVQSRDNNCVQLCIEVNFESESTSLWALHSGFESLML